MLFLETHRGSNKSRKRFWADIIEIKSKSQREFEAEKVNLYSSRPDLLRLVHLEKNEQIRLEK